MGTDRIDIRKLEETTGLTGEFSYRPEIRAHIFTDNEGNEFEGESVKDCASKAKEAHRLKYSYTDKLRDSLDTGDILLYSGTGPFSRLIQAGTLSKWSHCAMVVRASDVDLLLVYQSTTIDKVKDWTDGELKNGVQINLLSESLKYYKGDVAVRRLVDFERTPEALARLNKLRQEFKNRPYEESKLELVKAAYDGAFGENTPDVSSLFCSELVAECLKALSGSVFGTNNSNEYTPEDFANDDCFGDTGIEFGAIEYLKKN
jgi:hypothetical protein